MRLGDLHYVKHEVNMVMYGVKISVASYCVYVDLLLYEYWITTQHIVKGWGFIL